MIDSMEQFKEGIQQQIFDSEGRWTKLERKIFDNQKSIQDQGKVLGDMIDALDKKILKVFNGDLRKPNASPAKKVNVKASDFADKTVRHILDFEVMISKYFNDQVRDYVALLESPLNHHHKVGGTLDPVAKQAVDVDNQISHDGHAVDIVLGQKMNSLAWLLRSQDFIDDEHKQCMITAFRSSEAPVLGLKTNYSEVVTKTQAILTAIDEIGRSLNERDDDLAEKTESKNVTIVETEFVNSLVWPAQVLEVLSYNNEQA